LGTAAFADVDFTQTNLVSDLAGEAAHQDTNLVNPWGIVIAAGAPIWIADNGTGLSTVYSGSGNILPLVVKVAPPGGGSSSAPTGIIFNGTAAFGGSTFLFATEDGTISGWSGGSSSILEVDSSPSGAVYKGLAAGVNSSSQSQLYAANFHSGNVDVFNSSFSPVTIPGGFTDPNLPGGYAPFDIQNINGELYVTYALQDSTKHDDVPGLGHGFVDVYTTDGVLVKRLITDDVLNSPWGLAIAPASFGSFANDLLVGNFGDGMIHAYDPVSGKFIGTFNDSKGNPLAIEGLWGLALGTGDFGTSKNALYFTAGIPGPSGMVEDHGLFGSLVPVPEPGYYGLTALVAAALFFVKRRA
jgi:uncharacterized protein (TIGR03118 family)